MKNVIIYTNEFGGVSVCIPTGELTIEEVRAKDIPAGAESHIVPHDSLPEADNDFFNAWEQTGGVVTVSLAKAREITKARLRMEREPLLTALDVAYMRALEIGADLGAVVAEKQRLRDVTQLVEDCESLDELRALKVA